jgi:hypothetical protein
MQGSTQQQQQQQQFHHQTYASLSAIATNGQQQQQQYHHHHQQQQQYHQQQYHQHGPIMIQQPLNVYTVPTNENRNPNPQWQHQQPPPQQQQQQPTYEVYEPSNDLTVYNNPPAVRQQQQQQPAVNATNILSANDGTLMVQEVFLGAGQQISQTDHSTVNFVDLQAIWTCIRRASGSSNSGENDSKLLSVRMVNNGSSTILPDMRLQFQPNCFGLTIDPSISVLSQQRGGLAGGEKHNVNLSLYCAADNQTPPPVSLSPPTATADPSADDISKLTLSVEYRLSTAPHCTHRFLVNTFVPLHLFFQTHDGAPTDDGPRVAQTVFLSLWRNEYQTSTVAHSIAFRPPQPVPTLRWYQQFVPSGLLKPISNSICTTQDPSLREIIAIVEHKLSINRIYTVAAREADGGKTLVFFVSLRIGGLGAGSLVLGELRFSGDGFADCAVHLRSKISRRFSKPIERSIQAILLS